MAPPRNPPHSPQSSADFKVPAVPTSSQSSSVSAPPQGNLQQDRTMPSRFQGATEYMQGFVSNFQNFLSLLFTGEFEPDMGKHFNYDSLESYVNFHLVDGNGIHSSKFVFCKCQAAGDHDQQLMEAHIFPASVSRPNTGFNFNFMESSHLESLESKKSAYDFIATLCRKTYNAFPQTVPDVYKPFLCVMRVWRALVMQKHSGQCHGIDKHFPKCVPGGVVVPCFACPEPGFNMEEEDLDDEELRQINTLFLSADGHFGLQWKSKTDDPDDISLTEGQSCFPNDSTYQEYVKNSRDSTEKSTCAQSNAANFQNKLKFSGCVVSGVVGVTCAHHSTFKRDGIVDLTCGKWYANTDYALCGALCNLALVNHIVLTYDIACQYSIKLVEWFRNATKKGIFPSYITAAVEQLQLRDTKMTAAIADGEHIEGTWGEAKQAGGMTKEMNAGHCHDILNDFFNDWNWVKAQNLAFSLSQLYTKAKQMAVEQQEHFHGLTGRKSPLKHIKREVNGTMYINSRREKRQANILKEMVASEQRAEEASQARVTTPVAHFLHVGLKLQARQHFLQKALKPGSQDDEQLNTMLDQQRLRTDLKKWHQQQQQICPQRPTAHLRRRNYSCPDFNSNDHTKLGLDILGGEELKLRKGEANDALHSLHEHIRHSQALRQHKNSRKNAVHGQEKNTCAVRKIKDVQTKIQDYVNKYRQARIAMIALGCNPEDPRFEYPELKDADLYTKNVDQPHNLGDGGKVEGWIWWKAHVQWHRACADMERWQEEVEILSQEFRRAIQGFTKMEAVWTTLAQDHSNDPGKQAYALKTANMYRQMCKDAEKKFADVGGTWPSAGVSLAQHIRCED
ncbi:hypothetical protein C8R44DRAFT_749527 [Mycena epipterygia]|nr:hypothetical protein C8R44DRAFT_749527 [Mycena epipterygia]